MLCVRVRCACACIAGGQKGAKGVFVRGDGDVDGHMVSGYYSSDDVHGNVVT